MQKCGVMSAQHRMAECGDAVLDPKMASVQGCGVAPVSPGSFTQREDAWFGLRTTLICQWW